MVLVSLIDSWQLKTPACPKPAKAQSPSSKCYVMKVVNSQRKDLLGLTSLVVILCHSGPLTTVEFTPWCQRGILDPATSGYPELTQLVWHLCIADTYRTLTDGLTILAVVLYCATSEGKYSTKIVCNSGK